jgi:hypothetical protein
MRHHKRMSNTNAAATKTVKPTALNVWVLDRHFAGATRAPNRIEATSTAHMRRCLKAGLVVVEGTELVLTEAGIEALAAAARRAIDAAKRLGR